MSLRYPEQRDFSCFFVTTTFKEWRNFGNIKGLYEKLIESLEFCCNKYQAKLSAYVLMPSHIHLLLFIEGKSLSHFMRDFKKYIAQKASRDLGIKSNIIWNEGFDRFGIVSREVFVTKLNYIHNNPVKAELTNCVENWEWSSARDYYTSNPGRIEIYKDW